MVDNFEKESDKDELSVLDMRLKLSTKKNERMKNGQSKKGKIENDEQALAAVGSRRKKFQRK